MGDCLQDGEGLHVEQSGTYNDAVLLIELLAYVGLTWLLFFRAANVRFPTSANQPQTTLSGQTNLGVFWNQRSQSSALGLPPTGAAK